MLHVYGERELPVLSSLGETGDRGKGEPVVKGEGRGVKTVFSRPVQDEHASGDHSEMLRARIQTYGRELVALKVTDSPITFLQGDAGRKWHRQAEVAQKVLLPNMGRVCSRSKLARTRRREAVRCIQLRATGGD